MPKTEREQHVFRVASVGTWIGVALWIAFITHAQDPPTWIDGALSTAGALCLFTAAPVAIWLNWKWWLFP
jgi:hypothetical protein